MAVSPILEGRMKFFVSKFFKNLPILKPVLMSLCGYTVQERHVEILYIGSILTIFMDNSNNTVTELHHPNLKMISKNIFI